MREEPVWQDPQTRSKMIREGWGWGVGAGGKEKFEGGVGEDFSPVLLLL